MKGFPHKQLLASCQDFEQTLTSPNIASNEALVEGAVDHLHEGLANTEDVAVQGVGGNVVLHLLPELFKDKGLVHGGCNDFVLLDPAVKEAVVRAGLGSLQDNEPSQALLTQILKRCQNVRQRQCVNGYICKDS